MMKYPGGRESEPRDPENQEVRREEARRELQEIYKQAAKSSQQFLNTLNPKTFLQKPEDEKHAKIIQRTIYYLIVDISENEKEESGNKEESALEDIETRVKSLFIDRDFIRGFLSMQNFIIDALLRRSFQVLPYQREVLVGTRHFKKDEFEKHLVDDIRGWNLVNYANDKIQAEFPETEAGMKSRMGVSSAATLYMLSLAEYTYPFLDQINKLRRQI